MLPLHIHPRATNLSSLSPAQQRPVWMAENDAGTVHEILTPGGMTIFPQASVHMMMNLGCENAYTISELGGS